MKVIVLSSGSKGNTTYVETSDVKLLIDVGNSSKYIVNKLDNIGVSINDIDLILITHTHSDHIKGLESIIKKYDIKVYVKKGMLKDMKYLSNYQLLEDSLDIGNTHIDIIKTSHDAPDSVGYVISNDDKTLVYITDTGYINNKYFDILKNRDMYIMESNHDIEMLNNSSYPFYLRQRILSDKGHLSNYDSSKYISKFIGNKTKYVVLAHLSEENNTEELAYNELRSRLDKENKDVKIMIALQNKETELVEI